MVGGLGGVGIYFAVGLSVHLFCWCCELVRSVLCPRKWPDVVVEPRRKSEGGPVAPRGEGHEPYDYDTSRWRPYEVFKLVFSLLTGLLLVRLLLFVVFFWWSILFVKIGASVPRGSCPFRIANYMFCLGCKGLCTSFACYVSDVQGRERLSWVGKPGAHPIIVPNHITMVESFHMHWLTGGMSGVMAKSQLRNPGFSLFPKFLNVVIADTQDPDVKQKVADGISKFADNQPTPQGDYPHSRAFVIYPEGTTNSQRGLYRFNVGAFTPGKPVLPCVQRFPYKHMNPAWVSRSTVSEGNDIPLMFIRCMMQFSVQIQVKFLEVYEPTEAEIRDPTLFANNVQNYMALQLNCCVTDTGNKILREKGGPFDLKKAKEGYERMTA
eukprot:TRINITY_DN3268_c0_g1_i2.p1 TRINITY_DN3268_c0_g1~~TRINITY_DN3268_c0_g1_i2.p1  ORF type:complete len:380 (-),score=8.56 TRINITY_DN3268_c0_g1_i2:176-1315(-)